MPYKCRNCGRVEDGRHLILVEHVHIHHILGADCDGDPIITQQHHDSYFVAVCTTCGHRDRRWAGTDTKAIVDKEEEKDEESNTTTCGWCGDEYEYGDGYDDSYCSKHCYNLDHNSCTNCGESFDPDESEYSDYCCEDCADADRTGHCCVCGKDIDGDDYYEDSEGDVYCSLKCKATIVELSDDEQAEVYCHPCQWCGEQYDQRTSLCEDYPEKFCSNTCQHAQEGLTI